MEPTTTQNTPATSPAKMLVPATYAQYEGKWLEYAGAQEQSAFKREVYFLTQAIAKVPSLQKATPNSIVECLMNMAQFNLSLNPALKLAYIIPRRNGDITEAKMEPSYMGMAKMLVDAGAVVEIQGENIWSGDSVEIDMSAERKVKNHHPYWEIGAAKGDHRATYTTAYMPDGRISQYVMPTDEIIAIRDHSEGYRYAVSKQRTDSVWHLHFGEQAKKTCLRRHFKLLPKSNARMEEIGKVIEMQDVEHTPKTVRVAPKGDKTRLSGVPWDEAKEAVRSENHTVDEVLDTYPNLVEDQVSELRALEQRPFRLNTTATTVDTTAK